MGGQRYPLKFEVHTSWWSSSSEKFHDGHHSPDTQPSDRWRQSLSQAWSWSESLRMKLPTFLRVWTGASGNIWKSSEHIMERISSKKSTTLWWSRRWMLCSQTSRSCAHVNNFRSVPVPSSLDLHLHFFWDRLAVNPTWVKINLLILHLAKWNNISPTFPISLK